MAIQGSQNGEAEQSQGGSTQRALGGVFRGQVLECVGLRLDERGFEFQ